MLDFLNDDIFNTDWDLLVIPMSTAGSISQSFQTGLDKLHHSPMVTERNFKLGDVVIEVLSRKNQKKYVAFACSVDKNRSSYSAIRIIGKNLAHKIQELIDIREIATPILGTGAGKLDPFLSRNIMMNAFYEVAPKSVRLTFCTPDLDIYNSFEGRSLDINTPSGQLVIEAEIPNISQNDLIRDLQSTKEFYYELAEQKFQEYFNFEAKTENFYKKIEDNFNSSKLTFQDFLVNSENSPEQHFFTTLCGEVISYIDYHAYRKNIWNKYSDKRVLARSAVRQDKWFIHLLKFKRTKNLQGLSSSIRNALNYLKDPANNITMLSEKHRASVFSEILSKEYTGNDSLELLFITFRKLGFTSKNPKNFGALCSRILYLPSIKTIWFDSPNRIEDDSIIDEEREESDIPQASFLIENNLKTKSVSLDLGNCGLRNLAILPELFECIHLEELILSNEWASYENGKWKKIISQNKGKRNVLRSLPKTIGNLKNLKRLICSGDWNNGEKKWNRWSITSLSSIKELYNLEYLNLSNNKLRDIKGLNKLQKLKTIHLNNNEISSVEVLSGLSNLKEILLSNNFIKSVSFLKDLKSIQTIDLHNNKISDLRPLQVLIGKLGIVNDKWKVGTVNIAKNPLEQPPMEIVNIGKEAVLRTFEDVEKSGGYINKNIKIVLVGNSEAGKSTLVKYLDNENLLDQEHPPTLWMEEKIIKSKYRINTLNGNCILHVYDFGGHDYYHDTHHLFFTTNTVYILLWEEQTNNLNLRLCLQEDKSGEKIEVETQDYPLKYWLESIKYYIKDIEADNFEFEVNRKSTYNSSLLLVQNKVADFSKIFQLNNEILCKNYSFINDIINISIKNPKRNLNHFDVVFEEILNSMNIIGIILPKFYEDVINNIQRYKGTPVLSIIGFQDYCNSFLNNSIDKEQCQILIKYLQQIGLILYSENSGEGKVYINKTWVIENIHKVLLDLVKYKGEFDKDYIKNILGHSGQNDASDVLEMMLDFKMIFKHPYKESYIAPLYLPKMPEGKIKIFLNDKATPYRRFEYSAFIQKNIVLSIFQKYGNLISTEKKSLTEDTFYYWKDGLIIKKPGTNEIVMIKFHLGNTDGNACIDIYNISSEGKNSVFILEVVQYIKEVNKGYEVEEMVTINGEDFISTAVLEKNAKYGKLIFSERKLVDFSYIKGEEKLFHLKDYKDYMTEKIKRKKVVISYSKKDVAHVHTLKRYLQPLVDAELIEEPWYCTSLLPGDDWDLKIKEKFDEADVVLFMVSEYFYSTRYIVDYEIKNAINRYDGGQAIKIVPIILEFYDWGRKHPYNLQRFSALPYQAKPISDFNNPKIAWSTITTSVKMMIEKDLDPGKIEIINRDLQEIYERQVKGKLDKNSF